MRDKVWYTIRRTDHMEDRMMKKRYLMKLGLATLLSISLISGCTKSETAPEVDFDTFIDGLPTELIGTDNMNLEFLFEHPEKYGFTPELLNLPTASREDYEQSDKDTEELLERLESYQYDDLSAEQKITYDILKDSLTRSKGMAKYYDLDNSFLGSFVGFQAQLPLLLNEYTFETENDLNSYFHILETSPEVFQEYAKIEQERQKNGTGMSQGILNKVIEQCDNFSKDEHPFLIDSINKKIDALDFLDDAKKSEAKTKNETLLKESFVKAYKDLGDTLRTIEAPKEEVGLAKLPNGKEYYEYSLKQSTGLDDSVEDVRKYLTDKMKAIQSEMMAVMLGNAEVYKQISTMDDYSNVTYSKFTTFEDTIDYLGVQMKQDYPDVGTLNYDITIVPESMKDNFSPAAYLQGKIDAPKDAAEHIWVNGDYNQNLFETLAHEGYPGHMYQHTYFKQQNAPIVRYLIDYNGYSEGWATYIERNSWKYADVDDTQKELLHVLSLNSQYTQCIIGLLDIEIHYDGITYEEYTKKMKSYGFDVDAMGDDLKEQWYLILETPTNYLQYYLTGFHMQDLYDKAEEALGDSFDPVKFNEALLKNGPAPFHILEREVQAYIDGAKK